MNQRIDGIPQYDIDRTPGATGQLYAWSFAERVSRCHPIAPLVLYVPVIIAVLVYAATRTTLGAGMITAYVFLGLFIWSLSEYWLHRMLFHLTGASEGLKLFHRRIHGIHHEYPNDMTRVVFPPFASIPFALAFYGIFYAASNAELALPLFAGFASGYLWYDMTHWWTHAGRPRSAWGKMIRKHHMTHHFKTPHKRFGVTTPIWDKVFGTL